MQKDGLLHDTKQHAEGDICLEIREQSFAEDKESRVTFPAS